MYILNNGIEIILYLHPPSKRGEFQLWLLVFSGATSEAVNRPYRMETDIIQYNIVAKHMKNKNCFALLLQVSKINTTWGSLQLQLCGKN